MTHIYWRKVYLFRVLDVPTLHDSLLCFKDGRSCFATIYDWPGIIVWIYPWIWNVIEYGSFWHTWWTLWSPALPLFKVLSCRHFNVVTQTVNKCLPILTHIVWHVVVRETAVRALYVCDSTRTIILILYGLGVDVGHFLLLEELFMV